MTREHWKTVILAVIAAVLVGSFLMPMRTVSIRIDLPPAGEPIAEAAAPEAGSAVALAVGALAVVLLIVTIVLIVWVVRRCIRHVADARRPNPVDVF